MCNNVRFVEVIEYRDDFPSGHFIKIPISSIAKFYAMVNPIGYCIAGEASSKELDEMKKAVSGLDDVSVEALGSCVDTFAVMYHIKHNTMIEYDGSYAWTELSYEAFSSLLNRDR